MANLLHQKQTGNFFNPQQHHSLFPWLARRLGGKFSGSRTHSWRAGTHFLLVEGDFLPATSQCIYHGCGGRLVAKTCTLWIDSCRRLWSRCRSLRFWHCESVLRFRMARSIRLSWIRMSHPSSSISWAHPNKWRMIWVRMSAWHAPTPARGREGFTTPSFGLPWNGRATQLIS